MPRWGVPSPQQSQSAEFGIPQPWGCCSTGSSPCQSSSRWSSHCSSLPALPTALSSSFLVQNPHLRFHIQQKGTRGRFWLVSVLAGCPDLRGEEGKASGTILQPQRRGAAPHPTNTHQNSTFSLCISSSNTSRPLSSALSRLQNCREQDRGGHTEPGKAEH